MLQKRAHIVIILSCSLLCCSINPIASLILPPADKMRMGMVEVLRRECSDAAAKVDTDAKSLFEAHVKEGYQLAKTVFEHMVSGSEERKPAFIWLPSCANHQGEVERLTSVINDNSDLLGGISASFAHWPDEPASVIALSWSELDTSYDLSNLFYEPESTEVVRQAIHVTEQYVDNTLVRLRLCPYTQSLQRAAIGLESVGVQAGPVGVRHAANIFDQGSMSVTKKASPAAVLATLYWQGVTDLIDKPQQELSTYLLVAPSCYDEDFQEFLYVCDALIEKTVNLSRGVVGRVWFHPKYSLQDVEQAGTSRGGHAPPLEELRYLFDKNSMARPSPDDMARAHDKTRQTPHATINLLRTGNVFPLVFPLDLFQHSKKLNIVISCTAQLKAAESKDTKENRSKTFIRNVVRILEDEK